MSKLTLSMNPATVDLMKALAAAEGTSVSAMFARFVAIKAAQRGRSTKVGRSIRVVSGLIKMPKGATARQALEDVLLMRNDLTQ